MIAAASTNLYRSSHASTMHYNNFDADDESEHNRESYLNLLNSQTSSHQQLPPHALPSAKLHGLNTGGAPSDRIMQSITEE